MKKWSVSQEIVDKCVAELLERVKRDGGDYSQQPQRWVEYQALRLAGYIE